MYLMYSDESGNTGTDLDNKQQPIFALAGIIVKDEKWHKINDYFEEEKVKICPEFKNNEIHAAELFNAPKRSIFNKYSWEQNLKILEQLVDLITSLDIFLIYNFLYKLGFKKHINDTFGTSVKIEPYLYAFSANYDIFSKHIPQNEYGIIFTDDLLNISNSIELLYPKLVTEHKNIIEKTFYLDSKKNNFIQIADICALYINKFACITYKLAKYNEVKEKHCIDMFKKIEKITLTHLNIVDPNLEKKVDNFFK